jgi:hypothetical protein
MSRALVDHVAAGRPCIKLSNRPYQSSMRWFRSNLRHGSWLAFVALAINLALSFGHVHVEGRRGEVVSAGVLLTALGDRAGGGERSKHPGHPDDFCPICMAGSALGTGLGSAAPSVLVAFSHVTLDRTFATVLAVLPPPHIGFRSRGPPSLLTSLA